MTEYHLPLQIIPFTDLPEDLATPQRAQISFESQAVETGVREELHGLLFMVWHDLRGRGPALGIMPFEWGGPAERRAVLSMVRATLRQLKPNYCTIQREIWTIDSDDDPTITPDVVPSKHPKRQEGLLIVTNTAEGGHLISNWRITQVEGRRQFERLPVPDRVEWFGDLIDLYPHPSPGRPH